MIDSIIKKKCTGCEACASSCPKKCIRMIPDNEGFKYPKVNIKECILCKKCINICPVINFKRNHRDIVDRKAAFAYRTCNEEYRTICSSGGVFLSLANLFIDIGGIVYGAAFDNEFKLRHESAHTSNELIRLAGSKYLQSDINDIYKEIKEKLTLGNKVIFFGMTCQVEGLLAYLGRSYNDLYCVDLICMGIPSPMVWDKYLQTYYNKNNIHKINFKDKSRGWHCFSFYVESIDGDITSIPGFDNSYMECMFKGYSIRPSCFSCNYKCESKISDITIADCWGCEKYIPELDDNKGLSMVIVHSLKGRRLLSMLRETGIVESFDYNNVLKYNSNYSKSISLKRGRNLFYLLLKFSPRVAFELMGQNPQNRFIPKCKAKLKNIRNKLRAKSAINLFL